MPVLFEGRYLHPRFSGIACVDLFEKIGVSNRKDHGAITMAMRLEATLTIPALMDFTDPEYHPDYRVNVLSIQATKSFTAIGLSNGKIYLLDDDGKSKGVLESHGKMVWTMTSWPDSHLLITGDDNDIRVWDTNTRSVSWHRMSFQAIINT